MRLCMVDNPPLSNTPIHHLSKFIITRVCVEAEQDNQKPNSIEYVHTPGQGGNNCESTRQYGQGEHRNQMKAWGDHLDAFEHWSSMPGVQIHAHLGALRLHATWDVTATECMPNGGIQDDAFQFPEQHFFPASPRLIKS